MAEQEPFKVVSASAFYVFYDPIKIPNANIARKVDGQYFQARSGTDGARTSGRLNVICRGYFMRTAGFEFDSIGSRLRYVLLWRRNGIRGPRILPNWRTQTNVW